MRDGVQLIAYADRLGGTIPAVADVVRRRFGDAVTGIHLLPFFTPHDGADAGFDPVDHTTPDPRLGTWQDVRDVAATHDLVVDVIVNHVSSESDAFLRFLAEGEQSPTADLFLTYDRVFPDGASEADLTAIYRPRPGLPFTAYRAGGRQRLLWTTFTPQQIDIDVRSGAGHAYLVSILDRLGEAGVSMIRLDAAGYAVKRAGTSCFMTPETFDFIDEIAGLARERGMTVLVEIHSHFRTQIEIATRVDRVYDFALPPLVLHLLATGDVDPLLRWIDVRPRNAVTVLDTHDGIGVIDVGADPDDPARDGLLAPAQIDALVEGIHRNTGGESREATGAAASNLDLYQVNATFFAALGSDDERYLLARAVQFLLPGVPQVYYVGALAGGDDMELLAETGVGRDINRHRYAEAEVDAAFERPVVRALRALMRLRSLHPAFGGEFRSEGGAGRLVLAWDSGADRLRLDAIPGEGLVTLEWTEDGAAHRVDALLALAELDADPA
ncbi:sucrose phosphorylase [Microbacterium marinilacus]|uniref:Sucrose phosphorylase n=1 Tax=Microbacterium marinilacus TaxID=415209 RepID=A0ABP7BW80_9MICO|nr:sucrose phosphorylase [Microbacterium marinilacus]MBY0688120.1 sucrose phosphorylase [Microbacterium marinilacus]